MRFSKSILTCIILPMVLCSCNTDYEPRDFSDLNVDLTRIKNIHFPPSVHSVSEIFDSKVLTVCADKSEKFIEGSFLDDSNKVSIDLYDTGDLAYSAFETICKDKHFVLNKAVSSLAGRDNLYAVSFRRHDRQQTELDISDYKSTYTSNVAIKKANVIICVRETIAGPSNMSKILNMIAGSMESSLKQKAAGK